ncbi:MAG: 30S ribosomal protein S15 [Planctomycetes bacterium]|nr:30S ribosomal protein S15 [Planctomycetota bacterium]
MPIEAAKKTEVIKTYRAGDKDTGSTSIQIALLTTRIRQLTGHLQSHKKDFAARRGLLVLVGRRSRLLKYMSNSDRTGYLDLIQKLGIRA